MIFDDHEGSIQSYSDNRQNVIVHELDFNPGHVVVPFFPPEHPIVSTSGIVGRTLG